MGLATAKGLCLALGVPLFLPSSLTALALQCPADPGTVVIPCLDARRSEVYLSAVVWDGTLPPRVVLDERAVRPESVGSLLSEHSDFLGTSMRVVMMGEGAARYQEVLEKPVMKGICFHAGNSRTD